MSRFELDFIDTELCFVVQLECQLETSWVVWNQLGYAVKVIFQLEVVGIIQLGIIGKYSNWT